MRRTRLLITLLTVFTGLAGSAALACEEGTPAEVRPADDFYASEEARQPLELGALDHALLSEAIFHETNRRRETEGLGSLQALPELAQAACLHARDMTQEDFFAHENPINAERETPADRVRLVGLNPRFVAENLAQAFLLRYEAGEPVYPREEGGETVFAREPGGPPLEPHSYLSFAEALLDDWMASPGHRENILAAEPSALGAACAPLETEEMPLAYCVQVFFDPL